MKISVLGTGSVGRTLAARLDGLGHDVVVGTRDTRRTLGRGDSAYAAWQQEHPRVRLSPFAEAGAHGEIVLNALAGIQSLAALEAIGQEVLAGKVLLDLALPLDLSNGLPPTLVVANDDSLGEQIQRALPGTRVVKSLNSMAVSVMVDPGRVPGEHVVFVSGDDDRAKQAVTGLLQELGWSAGSIIDLGGIETSRAVEMYSQLFFALYARFGSFDFNIALARG
jgi:predicted dinucleotide-binding enzyme